MNTSANKQLVQNIFDETAKGNGRAFVDALDDQVEWRIIGSTSWSKTFVGKRAVVKELLGPLNRQFADANTIVAHRVLADGDFVVVEGRGKNRTTSGKAYENEYCWVIRLAAGKMVEIVEYADTALIESALEPLAPQGAP